MTRPWKDIERMDERLHKRGMAIAGLLVGLPTVAAGGTGAVLGLMAVWDGKYLTGDEYAVAAVVVGRHHRPAVVAVAERAVPVARCCRPSPITGHGLGRPGGLAASGLVVATLYSTISNGKISTLAFLGFGPPLLVMAGHLAWLRWARMASPPPGPG